MGARSGNNYLTALRKLKAEVWIGGERVQDPTVHPAFVHCARSVASLYDMQAEHPEAMTYRTEDGDRAGMSFIQPKGAEDVRKRSQMFRRWAEYSHGMMGRSPDYLNASIAAMAAAHQFFADSDPRFGETTYQLNNIVRVAPDPSLFQIPADYTIVDDKPGTFNMQVSKPVITP